MIGFVNRYAQMAGRTCCAGRSWVGLDRSLARRDGDTTPGSCELADFDVASDRDEVAVPERPVPEPDQVPVTERPVPEPDRAPVGRP